MQSYIPQQISANYGIANYGQVPQLYYHIKHVISLNSQERTLTLSLSSTCLKPELKGLVSSFKTAWVPRVLLCCGFVILLNVHILRYKYCKCKKGNISTSNISHVLFQLPTTNLSRSKYIQST